MRQKASLARRKVVFRATMLAPMGDWSKVWRNFSSLSRRARSTSLRAVMSMFRPSMYKSSPVEGSRTSRAVREIHLAVPSLQLKRVSKSLMRPCSRRMRSMSSRSLGST